MWIISLHVISDSLTLCVIVSAWLAGFNSSVILLYLPPI